MKFHFAYTKDQFTFQIEGGCNNPHWVSLSKYRFADYKHNLYIRDDVLAFIISFEDEADFLIFYGLLSKTVSFILSGVLGFSSFSIDPYGEVRQLLCRTKNEVFILDTLSKKSTSIYKVDDDETITDVVTNSFESALIIGVWTTKKVRFLQYKNPNSV